MRALITAVGHRTEHWTDFFTVLGAQAEVDLTLLLADVSPQTELSLGGSGDGEAGTKVHVLPHLLGEARSGHMASIMFAPAPLRRLEVDRPDVVHIIGEAAYLSTWQLLRWCRRRWPEVPVSLYAAQNVVTRFPPPFPLLERRAYQAVSHALPITPAALHVLRAKGYRGPATIVPLGVDTRHFTPSPVGGSGGCPPGIDTASPEGRFTVGFVGRLEPHKGIATLLAAVETLDVDLLVVGRGSLSPLVHAAAARRPERVRVVDWADHELLPSLLCRMVVLTLPSTEVIQRNVLPWVGHPAPRAVRPRPGRGHGLWRPGDRQRCRRDPARRGPGRTDRPARRRGRAERRHCRLRNDPGLARQLGEAGICRARAEFSWDRAAARTIDVWRDLAMARAVAVGNER